MHVGRTNFSKRIRLCCTLIRELRVLISLKRQIFIWNKDRTNTRPWYLKIRILLQYQFQLHCGTHMKYLKLNSRTNNLRSSFFLSSKDLEGWSCSLTLEWHSNLDNYVCHSTRWVFIAGLFEYLCTEIPTSKQDCRNRGRWGGRFGRYFDPRGSDYAHHITTCPPSGFWDLATTLPRSRRQSRWESFSLATPFHLWLWAKLCRRLLSTCDNLTKYTEKEGQRTILPYINLFSYDSITISFSGFIAGLLEYLCTEISTSKQIHYAFASNNLKKV